MCVTIDGLVNGFIYHVHAPLGTTSNYRAIVNLHKSQITTAIAKSAMSSTAVP
jgi:hypothetical protein